jgi:hypothetical protein
MADGFALKQGQHHPDTVERRRLAYAARDREWDLAARRYGLSAARLARLAAKYEQTCWSRDRGFERFALKDYLASEFGHRHGWNLGIRFSPTMLARRAHVAPREGYYAMGSLHDQWDHPGRCCSAGSAGPGDADAPVTPRQQGLQALGSVDSPARIRSQRRIRPASSTSPVKARNVPTGCRNPSGAAIICNQPHDAAR